MWKYYALMAALFASLTALFSKLGVENVDSDLALAIRVSFVLVLVWGMTCSKGVIGSIAELSLRNWLFLLLSAVATGLSWLFYFRALQIGDVSRVAPLDKLSVPLTIFLSIILLGEPVTPSIIIGGLLITAGSLVLLL